MLTTDYTEMAQDMLGAFVVDAGESFLVIECANAFGELEAIRIAPDDLAAYYAGQGNHNGSGSRTLAGLFGEWRQISELANMATNWFLEVNIDGLRTASRKRGLVPRF
jgi:hypothetical protein